MAQHLVVHTEPAGMGAEGLDYPGRLDSERQNISISGQRGINTNVTFAWPPRDEPEAGPGKGPIRKRTGRRDRSDASYVGLR